MHFTLRGLLAMALLACLSLNGCTDEHHVVSILGAKAYETKNSPLFNISGCVNPNDIALWYDAVSVLATEHLAAHLGVSYTKLAARLQRDIDLCLTPEPDYCCTLAGCAGPCPTDDAGNVKDCARKRGCTNPNRPGIWVSIDWPPSCKSAWPDEPHCNDQNPAEDWRLTLVTEVYNLMVDQIDPIYSELDHDLLRAVRAIGGPESRTKSAVRSILYK